MLKTFRVFFLFFILFSTNLFSGFEYDFSITPPSFNRIVFIPLPVFIKIETKDFKVLKDKFYESYSVYTEDTLNSFYRPDLSKYYFMLLEKREKEDNTIINISKNPINAYPKNKKVKVRFIFDAEINNVQNDVEAYAEVYLDKKNIGITEQKLLSQEKNFEFETTYEKHLLQIVVFLQDQAKKKWVRLKNIDQPRPIYFAPNISYENLYIKLTYYPDREDKKYRFSGSFFIETKN